MPRMPPARYTQSTPLLLRPEEETTSSDVPWTVARILRVFVSTLFLLCGCAVLFAHFCYEKTEGFTSVAQFGGIRTDFVGASLFCGSASVLVVDFLFVVVHIFRRRASVFYSPTVK